jgi:hypothetical protein
MMDRQTLEPQAETIVTALRRGAGANLIIAAFERIAVEFGAEAEEAVVSLVPHKVSKMELPRRRRNRRHLDRRRDGIASPRARRSGAL